MKYKLACHHHHPYKGFTSQWNLVAMLMQCVFKKDGSFPLGSSVEWQISSLFLASVILSCTSTLLQNLNKTFRNSFIIYGFTHIPTHTLTYPVSAPA